MVPVVALAPTVECYQRIFLYVDDVCYVVGVIAR